MRTHPQNFHSSIVCVICGRPVKLPSWGNELAKSKQAIPSLWRFLDVIASADSKIFVSSWRGTLRSSVIFFELELSAIFCTQKIAFISLLCNYGSKFAVPFEGNSNFPISKTVEEIGVYAATELIISKLENGRI